MKRKARIQESAGSRIADVLINAVGVLVILITLIPFMHVVAMSLSDPLLVMKQEIFLWPRQVQLRAYQMVLENQLFWTSYKNTIWVVVVGTLVNIFVTVLLAYPLSRRHTVGRRPIMLLITFTMFFSGGMVPLFIVVSQLGLYNNRWALILPSVVSTYNLIVCRTFFEGIPDSLIESAKLDGANDIRILVSIVLPLSSAIIAVLVLFYAVGHWNSYFPAMLYLPDTKLQPVQVYLVRVLIQDTEEMAQDSSAGASRAMLVQQLKYAVIIVTVLPIAVIYPFLQKYFVQGVMIGAIKG